MNYYRKTVDNTANDLKLKMQIGALTLKLSENNGNISSNTSLIDTNVSDISTLKTDVSNNYNFTQINKKKSEFNTSLIDTNRDNIASNLTKINSIEENNSKINNEKTDISDKFDENDKKIKAIDDKILSNNNLISNNFTSILPLKSNYVIDNILLFNLNSNKDINFKSNINRILVYETNIFYQFKPNSFIEINESIAYKYDNIKLYYYVLKENVCFIRSK